MKNLLIDIYKIKELHSGLGQFSLNFTNEITEQKHAELRLKFLVPIGIDKKILPAIPSENLIQTNFQKRYFPSFNKKFFVWHSLHQFPSFLPNRNTKWILTVHDLNFMLEKTKPKAEKYLRRLQKNINHADCVTAISHFTKREIEKNIDLKGKIVQVIHNGIAEHESLKSMKPDFISGNKFFFSIGIFNRKKNFHVLLNMMKDFDDYQLIIAGNNDTDYGNEIREEIIRLNLQHKIILCGRISDEEKFWLYENCSAFLFPSLAEGFGMPVIEAMKAGKPVFLSQAASLPEIGGEYAFYFDSFEETEMKNFIQQKLNYFEANKEKLLVEIKNHADLFTWRKCVSEYLNLYQKII